MIFNIIGTVKRRCGDCKNTRTCDVMEAPGQDKAIILCPDCQIKRLWGPKPE